MLGSPALADVDVELHRERVGDLERELQETRDALQQARADKETLEQRVQALLLENELKDRTILVLGREVEQLRQRLFGRSSEKEPPVAPPPASAKTGEPPTSQSSPPSAGAGGPAPSSRPGGTGAPEGKKKRERKKPAKGWHGRSPLPGPERLPRKTVEIHPSPEELICPCCGLPRRIMKGAEERTERVEWIPAAILIWEYIRYKWSCPRCEEGGVAIGELPPAPIERGRPMPGMLAYTIAAKYADFLPLNRQERILARHGLRVNRSTLAGWHRRAAADLRLIVREMTRQLLEGPLVRFDETAQPVLDEAKPKGIFDGRMWAYRDAEPGQVVFVYTSDKTHEARRGPKELLAAYLGYLQADAAGIFDVLFEDGTRVEIGCNAHARRYFKKAKDSEPEAAQWALGIYQQLYKVESEAKERGLTPEQRLALRRKRSVPLMAELYAQLERWKAEQRFLPKSAMGEAIRYALNHQVALCRFLEDGRLPIDNNDTERALRAVAIGRRSYLFSGSEAGAMDSATFFSLTVSCQELKIDPFSYLRDVLEKVLTHPASRIAELTPRGWKAAREREQSAARGPPRT